MGEMKLKKQSVKKSENILLFLGHKHILKIRVEKKPPLPTGGNKNNTVNFDLFLHFFFTKWSPIMVKSVIGLWGHPLYTIFFSPKFLKYLAKFCLFIIPYSFFFFETHGISILVQSIMVFVVLVSNYLALPQLKFNNRQKEIYQI
jgi:hypothetical protein